MHVPTGIVILYPGKDLPNMVVFDYSVAMLGFALFQDELDFFL